MTWVVRQYASPYTVFVTRVLTYSWVEHATSNPEEDPDVDSQSGSEGSSDVEKAEGQQRSVGVVWVVGVERGLGANVREEQEHEGPAKLTEHDNHQVAGWVCKHMAPAACPRIGVVTGREDGTEAWERHGDGVLPGLLARGVGRRKDVKDKQ